MHHHGIYACVMEFNNKQMPESNLVLRRLQLEDYDRGYLALLSQLTTVGDVSKSDFCSTFNGTHF